MRHALTYVYVLCVERIFAREKDKSVLRSVVCFIYNLLYHRCRDFIGNFIFVKKKKEAFIRRSIVHTILLSRIFCMTYLPKLMCFFFVLLSTADDLAALDETELADEEDYHDIARLGIVEVVGDDSAGRKIIVVSACKLPPTGKEALFSHAKLLRYLTHTLDRFVEQDYSLVYFHHGLTSKNKPPLSWLWQAYKAFDRKYKKNLKALYLVHPTNFIRIVWQIFKPAIR